jgi:hypothetical protein
MPDFLTDAVMDAIGKASAKTGIEFFQVEPADAEGGPLPGRRLRPEGARELGREEERPTVNS